MAVKKSVGPKKAASAPGATNAQRKPAFGNVWALPIAMLMLTVAASGLWFAMRESSNAPQAATPAATAAVMAPDAAKSKGPAAADSMTTAKPADSMTTTATAAAMKPVSISGCLQRDGEAFVLKNTEGTEAPKSRSWKSGFLRKRTTTVDLVDPSNAAHLATYVGQRVSVTGPVTDREMRVQSVHRYGAACQ